MDSIEYDAQLDKMILEQLNAGFHFAISWFSNNLGKSEEQIIREFFGQQSFGQRQPSKPKSKKEKEQEEIDHNPERVSIFEASKHFPEGFFSKYFFENI